MSDYEEDFDLDEIEVIEDYVFRESCEQPNKRQATASEERAKKMKLEETKIDPVIAKNINVMSSKDFVVCTDILKLIKPRKECATSYESNRVFRITRLFYKPPFLYIFLTGTNNVQFYFKCNCPIFSYIECRFHNRSCTNTCRPYKSFVITGLKTRECHRTNVIKINRREHNKDDKVLDGFCTDVNRVQMQTEIYEGDYVRFTGGVDVNEHFCASGSMSDIKKVPLEELTEPIDLITACYDLETYTNGVRFSNSDIDPIITISYVLRKQNNQVLRYCFLNTNNTTFNLDDAYNIDAEYCDGEIIVIPFVNERDMLKTFLEVIWRTNPDEVLDYNGDKFDIPYICGRIKQLGLDQNCIRRYDLDNVPFKTSTIRTKFGYDFSSHSMVYYNHTDVYQFIKSSYDASKMENMKLDTAANYYLNVGKVELSVKDMMALYKEGKFAKIVKYNVRDSILPIEIFFKCQMANKMFADASIMYLTRDDYLRTISHKINLALFNRCIRNRDENDTNEAFFFNKRDLNAIMGDKYNKQPNFFDDEEDEKDEDEGEEIDFTRLNRNKVPTHLIPATARKLCPLRTRVKYTGGKVLSPKPGHYKTTFTLDFSQLYTSIMIYITACMSNLFYGTDGYLYLQHDENAVTTKFLKAQAEQRAASKREMKKHDPQSFLYSLFDSWQNTNKLVCNSQYGWFGMFCKPLANEITMIGREKLSEAKDKIENLSNNKDILKKWGLTRMNLAVVYGDTDSNFVTIDLTDKDFAKLGDKGLRQLILEDILAPVNAGWHGSFKMELENIMKCMLIKGKKMYMCLKENGSLYKRGFNVKKDVPLFLRLLFDEFIKMTLTNHSLDCILNRLVEQLKKKKDEFCVENCELYSFSQTLNEEKQSTIAYKLYMILDDPNTKHIPASGDRIPYLLQDKKAKTVRDKAYPTQLFTAEHNMSWSKHLGIVCSFLNDMMAMLKNDTLFVLAFNQICEYLQKDQVHDIVHPVLKKMTDSRVKDILCKEQNIKTKKLMNEEMFQRLAQDDHKFIHTHEFTMLKSPAPYTIGDVEFSQACPQCNGKGVAAVDKNMSLTLFERKKKSAPKKKTVLSSKK